MLNVKLIWDQPLSTYAKSFEKLTFLTSWYPRVRVRIGGLGILVFRKILRTYLMDGPIQGLQGLQANVMLAILKL